MRQSIEFQFSIERLCLRGEGYNAHGYGRQKSRALSGRGTIEKASQSLRVSLLAGIFIKKPRL